MIHLKERLVIMCLKLSANNSAIIALGNSYSQNIVKEYGMLHDRYFMLERFVNELQEKGWIKDSSVKNTDNLVAYLCSDSCEESLRKVRHNTEKQMLEYNNGIKQNALHSPIWFFTEKHAVILVNELNKAGWRYDSSPASSEN